MARSHARIYTSIWADADFIALEPDPQRMFLFLISQPDLEHSGVIALRERRWSRASGSLTAADVTKALEALAEARFLVYDEDTEELLVRSLMRWDGVWKQPNVAKSAAAQIRTVASETLKAEIFRELGRLEPGDVHKDVEDLRLELGEDLKRGLAEDVCPLPEHPSPAPPRSPSLTPSGAPSGTRSAVPSPGGQGKGNTGSTTVIPLPPSPAPAPSDAAAGQPSAAADKLRPGAGIGTPTQRSKRLTDAYAAAEPMCRWPAVNGIVLKAIKAGKWTDDEIEDALSRLAVEGRSVTTETLRVELQGFSPGQRAAPSGNRRQQETDELFARAMQRAERREQVS